MQENSLVSSGPVTLKKKCVCEMKIIFYDCAKSTLSKNKLMTSRDISMAQKRRKIKN